MILIANIRKKIDIMIEIIFLQLREEYSETQINQDVA